MPALLHKSVVRRKGGSALRKQKCYMMDLHGHGMLQLMVLMKTSSPELEATVTKPFKSCSPLKHNGGRQQAASRVLSFNCG